MRLQRLLLYNINLTNMLKRKKPTKIVQLYDSITIKFFKSTKKLKTESTVLEISSYLWERVETQMGPEQDL